MMCRGLSRYRPYIPEPGDYLQGRDRELFLKIRAEMADVLTEFWPTDLHYIDVLAILLREQEEGIAMLERYELEAMYQRDCGINDEALRRIRGEP